MRKAGKASVPHNPPPRPSTDQGKLTPPPVQPNGYFGQVNDATTPHNRLRSGVKEIS